MMSWHIEEPIDCQVCSWGKEVQIHLCLPASLLCLLLPSPYHELPSHHLYKKENPEERACSIERKYVICVSCANDSSGMKESNM